MWTEKKEKVNLISAVLLVRLCDLVVSLVLILHTRMIKANYFSYHCKLTRRRRSNSINITVTTLWPRCSSMSDYSHKCRKRKFIQLHLNNSKHFCSSQYLFNKKSYDKKHIQFQYYLHFTLVWNVTFKKLKTFLFFSVLFKKKS